MVKLFLQYVFWRWKYEIDMLMSTSRGNEELLICLSTSLPSPDSTPSFMFWLLYYYNIIILSMYIYSLCFLLYYLIIGRLCRCILSHIIFLLLLLLLFCGQRPFIIIVYFSFKLLNSFYRRPGVVTKKNFFVTKKRDHYLRNPVIPLSVYRAANRIVIPCYLRSKVRCRRLLFADIFARYNNVPIIIRFIYNIHLYIYIWIW